MSTDSIWSCDFETTVYEGQERTDVWAAAAVKLFTEDVKVWSSLPALLKFFQREPGNHLLYFHNLKFDGQFWVDFLLNTMRLKQAGYLSKDGKSWKWTSDKYMPSGSFKYCISDRGQWYWVKIKTRGKIIEIRDSVKLLPFSVRELGEGFQTKHRKLDMEYEGVRRPGDEIPEKDREYIKNDVLVVKEALEQMYTDGHNRMTIGACCMHEFRSTYSKEDYEALFPDMTAIALDDKVYGAKTADEYIRKSYGGGWCYNDKWRAGEVLTDGCTVDANSLYPSEMHSESGNEYPVGKPKFWTGNMIPEECEKPHRYYFVRFSCHFRIKPGFLPFVHIRGTALYDGNENLLTSDVWDSENERWSREYEDIEGNIRSTRATLTMTCVDYARFRDHYDVEDFEIHDGCYFQSMAGIFDDYIDRYRKLKETSKGARRTEAKLFLNNLTGKMAASDYSGFRVAYVGKDGVIHYRNYEAHDKKPGYIPGGSAITSYARDRTIRLAQKNYRIDGDRGFQYADTDSLHCDVPPQSLRGIPLDDNRFCYWKVESTWRRAVFVRQKTYIEEVDAKEGTEWNIICAGMPNRCKKLFETSLNGWDGKDTYQEYGVTMRYSEEQLAFLRKPKTINDFRRGVQVPGKLLPKRIPGGVILVDNYFTMR